MANFKENKGFAETFEEIANKIWNQGQEPMPGSKFK